MVSTIWVPATAQSFSVICEVKTAAWSSTRSTSTGHARDRRRRRSRGGRGCSGVTSGVGDGDGSGVTTTVGSVGRSGGGSIKFSTRADQRSKRSPMPRTLARTTAKPVTNRTTRSSAATGQRRRARVFMVGLGENDRRSRLRQHGPMPAPPRPAPSCSSCSSASLVAPAPARRRPRRTWRSATRSPRRSTWAPAALTPSQTLTVTNHSSRDARPPQPVGRSACARLPDDARARSRSMAPRSTPSGRPASICGSPLADLEPRRDRASPRSRSRSRSVAVPTPSRARTSAENGVLSFGQWFPIVSTEHDVYGLGDPQISFTAETIRLELTTTSAARPRRGRVPRAA